MSNLTNTMNTLVKISNSNNLERDIKSRGIITNDDSYQEYKKKRKQQEKELQEKVAIENRINKLENEIERLSALVETISSFFIKY